MNHYTYKLTAINPKGDAYLYVGVRSCECLPEDDTSYMSSSKSVHQAIKEGVQFSKEILQVFPSRKKAVAHEVALHSQFEVATNPKFFNKAKQTSIGFDTAGVPLSDEHKAKLHEIKSKDEFKIKHRNAMKEAIKKESYIENQKKARAKTTYKKKTSKSVKKALSNPISKQKQIDGVIRAHKRPEVKEKHRKAIIDALSKPEIKEKLSVASKANMSNPEIKAKQSKALREAMSKPEYRKMVSENTKKSWENPEIRQKQVSGMKSDVTKAKRKVAAAVRRLHKQLSGHKGNPSNTNLDLAYNWLADNGRICLIN